MKSHFKSRYKDLPSFSALEKAAKDALYAVKGQEAVARREAAIRVMSHLLVHNGSENYSSAANVNARLPLGIKRFRNDHEVWRVVGGLPVVAKRLREGNIIVKGSLGEWTPDFLHGLTLSGAMRSSNTENAVRNAGKVWRSDLQANWITYSLVHRPALKEALGGDLPFSCRTFWRERDNRYVLSSAWAFGLGADNPDGVGVLAGVLAGGRLVIRGNRKWLSISGRSSNVALLESYSIPFTHEKCPSRYGALLVSPFWGALLAKEMPEVFGKWFEGCRGFKGMCPLLPWAFLRAVWDTRVWRNVPKWVPFLVHRNDLLLRHGIRMNQIRREAFVRFGFSRVDPRLRVAWLNRLVLMGIRESDFPNGKIPLDFDKQLCHVIAARGGSL